MSSEPLPFPDETDGSPPKPLRLVVVTGMSGAGRSTAANTLEDLGWYVVDNLPPTVLPEVCEQARNIDLTRLAVVLDVRTRGFFEQLPTMFADLSATGTLPEILFLEAGDDVIVRRQESVRRPHPLQGDGRLLDGIVRGARDPGHAQGRGRPGDRHVVAERPSARLPGDPRVRRDRR